MLKEVTKAMADFKKGLELDPENKVCREGLHRVEASMFSGQRDEQQVTPACPLTRIAMICSSTRSCQHVSRLRVSVCGGLFIFSIDPNQSVSNSCVTTGGQRYERPRNSADFAGSRH